jgi:YesN/AraC family two-component response regulator
VLALVDQHPPRLVITDALMPKMDGRELCRQIKDLDLGVKVIIMTSLYTAPHYKYEAYKQFHADGYLPKPIDFEELHKMMERLCPLSVNHAVTAVHA